MKIIGRQKEIQELDNILKKKRSSFLTVYGRRRVGKTYLIREYFNNHFTFSFTGSYKVPLKTQLRMFKDKLIECGYPFKLKKINDWFDAFNHLKELVKNDESSNKKVIFLDEVPWMDTAKSNFKTALEYFWNDFASTRDDVLLIICGSATSWILNNINKNTGGLYRRVTNRMLIEPFTLKEIKKLLEYEEIELDNISIMEAYMIFGGIPFYFNLLDSRESLHQNIDRLCFNQNGELYYELNELFRSLFKDHETHLGVIRQLAKNRYGLTRDEIISSLNLKSGMGITSILEELIECRFIRQFNSLSKSRKEKKYQLIDHFTLFALKYMDERKIKSWTNYASTQGYFVNRGLAFELLIINHLPQLKSILGISAVQTDEYSYRILPTDNTSGAQIDLVIDRNDKVINLIEIRFSPETYTIDEGFYHDLIHKLEAFRIDSKTKKAVNISLITPLGVRHNKYIDAIAYDLSAEDFLFI